MKQKTVRCPLPSKLIKLNCIWLWSSNTAAGLRYVFYIFLTDLNDPSVMIKNPGGYFIAPEDEERIGNVSNVIFTNGWIAKENGEVLIYYGSSNTRKCVATIP